MELDEGAEITDEINEEFRDSLCNTTNRETTTWTYDGEKFEVSSEHELS